MRRKVIQIADSTQLVSLPRKWALKYGIKKGDEVNIEEEGGKLIVEAEKSKKVDKISVDFDQFSPLAAKCALDVLHKSGYDEMEITYSSKEVFKELQQRLLQLIGCDVVEQTERRLVIKDITEGSLQSEFDNLFRRVFRITLSMAENSIAALKKGDLAELEEYALTESTNNKLVNYCQRILTKKGISDSRNIHLYYVTLWYLESVADDYRDLLHYIATTKDVKMSKEFIELFEEIGHYFHVYHDTFFKYDKKKLEWMYSNRKPIIQKGAKLFTSKKDDPECVRLLLIIPHNLFDILPIITGISARPQEEKD